MSPSEHLRHVQQDVIHPACLYCFASLSNDDRRRVAYAMRISGRHIIYISRQTLASIPVPA